MEKSKFLEMYKAEAAASLALLEKGIVGLEKNGSDAKQIQELFRAAHTLKGNSRMMGFSEVANVAHRLEDVFERMQQKKLVLKPAIADVIFEAVDVMKKDVQNALNGKKDSTFSLAVLEKLAKAMEEHAATVEVIPLPTLKEDEITKAISGTEIASASSGAQIDTPEEMIRVPLSRINNLLNLTGEIVVSKVKSSYKIDLFKKIVKQVVGAEKMLFDLKTHIKDALGVTDEWIYHQGAVLRGSKDMGKAVPTLNQLHQLDLTFDRIRQNVIQLSDQIQTETFQLNPVIEELQERMKEIRMLPCHLIFEGFPRLIRDISREQEKEVDLIITGSETELDKTVLEAIKAPLIHVLRNAIDHGVESPEDRARVGKPRKAKISLSAFQEGSKAMITISDDGQGIDLEAVKKMALKKQLVEEEVLNQMGQEELLNLIFLPGFSTASMITDVSGRGVGLDVVKTELERLKGEILVQSQKGQGTTFRLELPLTIAILQVLLVEAGGLRFAFPITSLEETLHVSPEMISTIQNQMIFKGRDKTIPLIALTEVLGIEKKTESSLQSSLHVLVLNAFHKKLGFIVDRLIGKEEVFIKGLGVHLGNLRGVNGAAILSSGEGVVILDPQALAQESLLSRVATKISKPRKKIQKKKILLVEDSLTTRELEKVILENGGYEVETAIDGLNALEKLSKGIVDAIVSDINMPRMDGFELCHNIKTNEKFKEIPFVFVSSLAKEEEKRKGMAVGAQAYIVKSQFDQGNLLDTIERLVA